MGMVWTALVLASLLFAALGGRVDATAQAAIEGAGSVKRTRHTIPAALCADAAEFLAAAFFFEDLINKKRASGLLAPFCII